MLKYLGSQVSYRNIRLIDLSQWVHLKNIYHFGEMTDESKVKRITVTLSIHCIMYVFKYCKACDSFFLTVNKHGIILCGK